MRFEPLFHLGDEGRGLLFSRDELADLEDILIDILDSKGLKRTIREARRFKARDHLLMAGDGKRSEDEIRLKRPDPFGIDREIGPDSRQPFDDLSGKIRMIIDANKELRPAERTDNLRI